MAVAHDLATESAVNTSSSSFNWSHGGSASAKGVVVFVCANNATNPVTSVTYGGVGMTAVDGGEAIDSAGEPASCKAYFLADPPTGTQTVVVNRTNNAVGMWANASTQTGTGTLEVTGVQLVQGDGALAEVNIDDGSPGTDSLRYACGMYGGNDVPSPGANSTALVDVDPGAFTFSLVRETTAGQGSRPVGFSNVTSDDRAVVHLAVREAPAAGSILPLVACDMRNISDMGAMRG